MAMDKEDIKQDKAIIKKAFKMHDKQEHKGSKGTNLDKLKKGGKVKKMAAGGKTNEGMLSEGRNRQKYSNQFGSVGLKGKGF
jgi:hypothetical protein